MSLLTHLTRRCIPSSTSLFNSFNRNLSNEATIGGFNFKKNDIDTRTSFNVTLMDPSEMENVNYMKARRRFKIRKHIQYKRPRHDDYHLLKKLRKKARRLDERLIREKVEWQDAHQMKAVELQYKIVSLCAEKASVSLPPQPKRLIKQTRWRKNMSKPNIKGTWTNEKEVSSNIVKLPALPMAEWVQRQKMHRQQQFEQIETCKEELENYKKKSKWDIDNPKAARVQLKEKSNAQWEKEWLANPALNKFISKEEESQLRKEFEQHIYTRERTQLTEERLVHIAQLEKNLQKAEDCISDESWLEFNREVRALAEAENQRKVEEFKNVDVSIQLRMTQIENAMHIHQMTTSSVYWPRQAEIVSWLKVNAIRYLYSELQLPLSKENEYKKKENFYIAHLPEKDKKQINNLHDEMKTLKEKNHQELVDAKTEEEKQVIWKKRFEEAVIKLNAMNDKLNPYTPTKHRPLPVTSNVAEPAVSKKEV